jgi:hypothetical protein
MVGRTGKLDDFGWITLQLQQLKMEIQQQIPVAFIGAHASAPLPQWEDDAIHDNIAARNFFIFYINPPTIFWRENWVNQQQF